MPGAMAPPQSRGYKTRMTAIALRNDSLWRYAPAVLLLGSGGLLLGALFFQYVMDLPPCPLCHWQRWPHIVVVVLAGGWLLFSAWLAHDVRRDAILGGTPSQPLSSWTTVHGATLMLILIGLALLATAGIGLFHAGVEQKWWQGLAVCEGAADAGPPSIDDLTKALNRRPPPRCDQIAWSLLGLSMAAWNALISLALAAFAFRAAFAGGRAR